MLVSVSLQPTPVLEPRIIIIDQQVAIYSRRKYSLKRTDGPQAGTEGQTRETYIRN